MNDDIIRVCEGTYPGNVTINKKVIVEGRAEANRADVKIEVAAAGTNGLIVAADGVTIRHLTLDGPTSNDNGILLNAGTDDATISDVEATDWDYGIYVNDSTGTVVEDSSLHDNAEDGVLLGGGERNTVRDNEIKKNGDDGVYVDDSDEALVEGNTISGNTNEQIEVYDKSHVRIHRNQIDTTSGDGIWIGGGRCRRRPSSRSAARPRTPTPSPAPSAVPTTTLSWTATLRTQWTPPTTGGAAPSGSDIANRIFNDEDDIAECAAPDDVKGAVVFHPWATGPAPTPTPSPTPSPTATPTATGTPTPTATPGATRTIDLSPQGWHDLAWSGANATDPGTALACIAGKYSIAYAWEGPTTGFKRYVEGCAIPGICNMADLNKYDTLLVNISAAGVTCVMPVVP